MVDRSQHGASDLRKRGAPGVLWEHRRRWEHGCVHRGRSGEGKREEGTDHAVGGGHTVVEVPRALGQRNQEALGAGEDRQGDRHDLRRAPPRLARGRRGKGGHVKIAPLAPVTSNWELIHPLTQRLPAQHGRQPRRVRTVFRITSFALSTSEGATGVFLSTGVWQLGSNQQRTPRIPRRYSEVQAAAAPRN